MGEDRAVANTRKFGLGLAGAGSAIVRRAKAIVLLPLAASLLALLAVAFVPDHYSASAIIQIDPRPKLSTASQAADATGPVGLEAQRIAIEKEMQALRSPSLLDDVVEALHLGQDPEFATPSLIWRMLQPFAKAGRETFARETLASGLTIRRVHSSSLINIRAESRDPVKAAAIANAVAARYIAQDQPGASPDEAAQQGTAEPTASEKVFQSVLNQYGLTRTLAAARVVDSARPARRPAGPQRLRIVAATGISTFLLMLALALALERDARQRTRKVEKMLACPHMTSLPSVKQTDAPEMRARRARLIIAEPGCRYAEAVRTACQELLDRSKDRETRVIMVASALANEGSESFASNIAHHFAIAGQKALLVDCDLEGKGLTRQLAPGATMGLLDQIAAHGPIENVILRDNMTGVHFLPACGPAPIPLPAAAALRSVEFAAAFRHLRARFPTIVISAPPLLEAPDVRVLADLADQIVFLTAWHRTPRALAKRAVMLLEGHQSKIVGAVLADIADDREPGLMSFAAMFDEIRRAARLPKLDRAA
ncbi:MAG: Wzz/FepE/Etk N-terminal domain-containing protein [Hyphomicrobium sp.]|uniref:tyrosine-protein kinase domain-containing protein n=1 Tax=Hyphomicrobium sp. TaxID=82 RepID=UPI0039E5D488